MEVLFIMLASVILIGIISIFVVVKFDKMMSLKKQILKEEDEKSLNK